MSSNDLVTAFLPIADLHESPFNERQHFDQAELQSLAENIRHEGILQLLLVRPRVPEMFKGDPDAVAGYEVVCGHRRLRAAAIVGLERVPCVVRSMTDIEAKSAQVSENLQRENVKALEEAEALRSMMEDHGLSVADLITRTGKTRSYIYGRLKLLTLNAESRKAFLAGDMQIEIALVLARMPSEKLQLDALAKIKSNHIDSQLTDGGKAGYRRIKDFLHERYTTDLKGALFPLDDAELLAGAGACTNCPKRSGQTPELFGDIVEHKPGPYSGVPGGANVCTDPDCFAEKKKLQLKREQTALEAKGQVVVSGGAARNSISASGEVKGAYIALEDVTGELAKARTNAHKDSKIVPPQVVLIQDPRTGKTKKAVKVADLKAAGVKVKESSGPASNEAARQKREAESKRREEKWEIEAIARRKLLDVTRATIASSPRNTFDMQHIARMAFAGVAWQNKSLVAELWGSSSEGATEKRIGSMSADDAARFMLDCALVENVDGSSHMLERKPDVLLAFAKHYNVDVELARIGGLTPTPAAQAITPAATKKPGKKSTPAAAGGGSGHGGLKRVGKAFHPTHGTRPAGEEVKDNAGVAGEEVKDEAGVAGQAAAQAELLAEGADA
ncbi:MAG: ParB/RepB/Spo0J family partition protein [Burkholderiaceae bacterium]